MSDTIQIAIGATRRRALLLVVAVGVAAAWPAVADETRNFQLKITGRKVSNSDRTIKVTEGDRIEIVWTTDEAVEIHLHGYDIKAELIPGAFVTMAFEAPTAGRFPITAHDFGHATLAYLEVHPR